MAKPAFDFFASCAVAQDGIKAQRSPSKVGKTGVSPVWVGKDKAKPAFDFFRE